MINIKHYLPIVIVVLIGIEPMYYLVILRIDLLEQVALPSSTYNTVLIIQ